MSFVVRVVYTSMCVHVCPCVCLLLYTPLDPLRELKRNMWFRRDYELGWGRLCDLFYYMDVFLTTFFFKYKNKILSVFF